jgi:hypothetical protein
MQLGALGVAADDPSGASGGLYDVLLCTSELINASLIAGSTAMTLRLVVRGRTVRLSLRDDCDQTSNGTDTRMRAQLLGVYIFDAVARRWGIDPAPGGRLLWAELDIA